MNEAAKIAVVKLELLRKQLQLAIDTNDYISCVRIEAQIFIVEELYLTLLRLGE